MSIKKDLTESITDLKQLFKENQGMFEVLVLTSLFSIGLRLYWFYDPFLLSIPVITTIIVFPFAAYRINTAPINILLIAPLYIRSIAILVSFLTLHTVKYIQLALYHF